MNHVVDFVIRVALHSFTDLRSIRGLSVDHSTVWRWVQAYAPEIRKRVQGHLNYKLTTWFMDETYVQVAGRWMYLFRAVDSHGQTVEFYLSETETAKPPNGSYRRLWRTRITGHRTSCQSTGTAAIRQRSET